MLQYLVRGRGVRIIAGKWKGTPLAAPPGRHTRPTGDRVKEALFSMIGPYFAGGRCLDLFAGSGALGLEALSRGIEFAVFVDVKSASIVRRNVQRLQAEEAVQVLPVHYEKALRRFDGEDKFDLVFLDPPYALGVLPGVMHTLVERRLLRDGATVVAEMDRATPAPEAPGLRLDKCGEYGATRVCIYRAAATVIGKVGQLEY